MDNHLEDRVCFTQKSINKIKMKRNLPLHLMLIPGLLVVLIYNYGPLFGGILMVFKNYRPSLGFIDSKWVGLDNIRTVLSLPDIGQIVWNTFYMSAIKIVLSISFPIIVALLINEIRNIKFVKSVQTLIYLPNFISWVILSGVFIDILSPSSGLINQIIKLLGFEPIFFLGSNEYFRGTMIVTDIWKNFGYNTIIYFAALTGINEELYEAAKIDGANRLKQIWHVTLPGIKPIVLVMIILSLGSVLNAGFDQIYNFYNPSVYRTGDIIDTFVFRLGFEQAQYSLSATIGLLKSVVSLVLTSASYWFAYKFSDYRIL